MVQTQIRRMQAAGDFCHQLTAECRWKRWLVQRCLMVCFKS